MNILEGAYYYKELEFSWKGDAWLNTPSIFAIQSSICIQIPYPKRFMQIELIPVIYFPFQYKKQYVSVLDDDI